jgi:hypothetical protein
MGITLEKFANCILRSIFPKSKGYRVLTVDWSNYENDREIDLRVFEGCKQILQIECKNWRDIREGMYGPDVVAREILPRFNKSGGWKILFLSHKCIFTKNALRVLGENHIHIIEIGKVVEYSDFKTRLLYQIKAQVKGLIAALTSKLAKSNRVNIATKGKEFFIPQLSTFQSNSKSNANTQTLNTDSELEEVFECKKRHYKAKNHYFYSRPARLRLYLCIVDQ